MTNSIDAKNDAAQPRAESSVPDLDSVVAALGELDDEATIERAGKVHAYIVASGLAVTGGSLLDMVDEARTQVDAIELDEEATQPMRCTLDEFLCGADGADPWCKQKFADYIGDIDLSYWAEAVEEVSGQPNYGLVASPDSALLLHRVDVAVPWKGAAVVGYYNTPGAVCIADAHQGRGLGAELILWTAINFTSGPPTEGLDEQMFSAAGYAAHRSAWRLGVTRGLILDESEADQELGGDARKGDSDLVAVQIDFFRELVEARNLRWSMPPAVADDKKAMAASRRSHEVQYRKRVMDVLARLHGDSDLRAQTQSFKAAGLMAVDAPQSRTRTTPVFGPRPDSMGVPVSFFRKLIEVHDLLWGIGKSRRGWVGTDNLGKPEYSTPLTELFVQIEREPMLAASSKKIGIDLLQPVQASGRDSESSPSV